MIRPGDVYRIKKACCWGSTIGHVLVLSRDKYLKEGQAEYPGFWVVGHMLGLYIGINIGRLYDIRNKDGWAESIREINQMTDEEIGEQEYICNIYDGITGKAIPGEGSGEKTG